MPKNMDAIVEPPFNNPIWQKKEGGWIIPKVCRNYEYALNLLKAGYFLREYIEVERTFIVNDENSLPITDKVLLPLFKLNVFKTMYVSSELFQNRKVVRQFYYIETVNENN